MNLELLIPLVATTIVAIAGWLVGHRLESNRDQKNKKREIRLDYLIRAYRDLGMAADRDPGSPQQALLESAFHDVQLFGSPSQLAILDAILREYMDCQHTTLNPLLSELRRDLRQELGLPEATLPFAFFRVKKGRSKNERTQPDVQ